MREISLTGLKDIELEILQFFHDYCEENEFKYYLIGGTLLGAVRHNGFIPWDDDIDIAMPRDDYERMLKHFELNNVSSDFEIIHYENNKKYYLPFAKVISKKTVLIEELDSNCELGVFIDIFPLDRFDYSQKELLSFYKKQNRLIRLATLKTSPAKKYSGIKRLIAYLYKISTFFISANTLAAKVNENARKNSNASGRKTCVAVCLTYGIKEFIDSEVYSERVLLEFEGHSFYAPKGFQQVLSSLYGEYMKLPPMEKRVTHHCFKAYYKG